MKRNEKVLKLIYIALFAALTAALSQVAIPTPWVPLTLQTFAAALCGYMLGWKGGLAALAVYLLLGAAGVPVFANFKAGAQALVGPTGGFLFGFLPMAALCGLQIGRKRAVTGILLGLLGLLLCHAAGALQYAWVSHIGAGKAFLLVSLPYLLKDALSVAGAYFLARVLRKRIPHLNA